jgi:hypothetical protein
VLPQFLDDPPGPRDQRRIALGQHAARQIEVILQPHAHMPAQDHRLRHHRELRAADAEGGPDAAGRDELLQRQHGLRGGGRAPGDAEAKLEPGRRLEQAALDHIGRQHGVAEVEDLQLGLHAGLADHLRHGGQVGGRVDEGGGPEIHRGDVERADVGLQLQHMRDPLLGRAHALGAGVDVGVLAGGEAGAGAGGQVDQHIAAGIADAAHRLAVEGHIARGLSRFGIADVDMDDGRPRGAGGQRLAGELRRRDGHMRRGAGAVGATGEGGGDDDGAGHGGGSCGDLQGGDFCMGGVKPPLVKTPSPGGGTLITR